jgi:uncharacterized protein (TIGR01244 family)
MRKPISQHVSTGTQPLESQLKEMKGEGVTTVVNLRLDGEESPLTPGEEQSIAEKLGLEYHHLPVSLDELDASQVKELREILNNSKGSVFVHCGAGQRACSLSLAASGLDPDSIFEESAKLGFPVKDDKLRSFLKALKQK